MSIRTGILVGTLFAGTACMPPELTHGPRVDPGVSGGIFVGPALVSKDDNPKALFGWLDAGVSVDAGWQSAPDGFALRGSVQGSLLGGPALDLYAAFPEVLPSTDFGVGAMVQQGGAAMPYLLLGHRQGDGAQFFLGQGLWLSGHLADTTSDKLHSATFIGYQTRAVHQYSGSMYLMVVAGPQRKSCNGAFACGLSGMPRIVALIVAPIPLPLPQGRLR